MKAWKCGWSVRHYAETEKLLKDITSHVCFLIIRGGSNSSFLLGLDGCRKTNAMPSVTPGTQPVGCRVVSTQPAQSSAAAPTVGPQFGCHGTVLGASVKCGVAGVLSGTPTGKEGRASCPRVHSNDLGYSLPGGSELPLPSGQPRWGLFSLFRLGWKHILGEEAYTVSSILALPVSGFWKPFYWIARHSSALDRLCD